MHLLDKLQVNFEEVEPPLSSQEAIDEATRCLYCYDAPCITACPTGIDIPGFIKKNYDCQFNWLCSNHNGS